MNTIFRINYQCHMRTLVTRSVVCVHSTISSIYCDGGGVVHIGVEIFEHANSSCMETAKQKLQKCFLHGYTHRCCTLLE